MTSLRCMDLEIRSFVNLDSDFVIDSPFAAVN